MIHAPQKCNSLYGIETNELFRDSGFEDKQNRALVMTRKGIIYHIFDFY